MNAQVLFYLLYNALSVSYSSKFVSTCIDL